MSTGEGSATRELPILMAGGGGEPERLLLVGVPDPTGMVQVRMWTSEDWSATVRTRGERRDAFLEWIEAQVKAGRSLNQSLHTVRQWLRAEGTATR
jgi:hypothetical protein